MKHTKLLFFFGWCILASGLTACGGNKTGSNTAKTHRYEVESGEISYRLNGIQQGYETVYFDQWGAREARYTKATLKVGSNVDRKVDRMILTDKEWVYSIDFLEKTGTKMRNPAYDQNPKQISLNPQDLSRINAQKLFKLGGQKTGQDQVTDLTCDVWEVKRLAAKFWIWKQIVLKRIPKIATERTITREAVRVTTGQKIADEKFALPKNIEIQDLSTKSLSH
ncbi:hypothetical protein [Microscilla marina]|uniref:Lipoprotein, putative n=1 Tax=Microscilla marina ATCC 23134 TaxID=313606 RepID=A1ZZJ3_MICM2|nr:hypothetical protein [Microscilla marina]EAY24188.1 lipoprotein, putative [Microscilla marina ATCC 23134]